ncbi:hypothetical protein O181_015654 [Austropuccinia psidii MF-1]|uniref:Solute carrier family 35 member F1 n=1 Tax=Austropuccinia psidii MF-1 TaxID=1389203 RepID=A0A9Q3C2E3_9BASI|nr:hypothetical protein [Austropuccinia psidii MF-1]
MPVTQSPSNELGEAQPDADAPSTIKFPQEPSEVPNLATDEPVGPSPPDQSSTWTKVLLDWKKKTFTKRFCLALLAGQFVSCTIDGEKSIETTELVKRGWVAPTTQSLFLYFALFLVYTPLTLWKYGLRAWINMLWTDGYKYIFLAALDVEGNFTVVKAYQYTDLLSAELLDAWAVPVCMLAAAILMGTSYHWTQYLGVLICIAGLSLLVVSDMITDKNYEAQGKAVGDGLMLVGATFYGLSNALQEYLVRKRPLYEVVGQLGFWGTIINGIQAAALEHSSWSQQAWNLKTIGLLAAYTTSMLLMYTVVPILFRMASSPFYNLSILTSDFYGLIFGFGLYHYKVYWLYFLAYPLTLSGLMVYFSWAKPETQGKCNVVARGKQRQVDVNAFSGGKPVPVTVPEVYRKFGSDDLFRTKL